MEPVYRYWTSKDHRSAVVALFDDKDKMNLVTIDLTKAAQIYPDMTVSKAVYTLAITTLTSQSSN